MGSLRSTGTQENKKELVARVISLEKKRGKMDLVLAFPEVLWNAKLSHLLHYCYGKTSFFEGVQLREMWFSDGCFKDEGLRGPLGTVDKLRTEFQLEGEKPFFMGSFAGLVGENESEVASMGEILKTCSKGGMHFLSDDPSWIESNQDVYARAKYIAEYREKEGIKCKHVVLLNTREAFQKDFVQSLESIGVEAFIINPWITGLDSLQYLRKTTNNYIFSSPIMAGAFGVRDLATSIHPQVTMGAFMRAGGADFVLYPSAYGRHGVEKETAKCIVQSLKDDSDKWSVPAAFPVMSYGMKPEHVSLAKRDHGTDFIFNAGITFYDVGKTLEESLEQYTRALYN